MPRAASPSIASHRFHSRGRAICDTVLRAFKERFVLSVLVERGREHKIKELVIRCRCLLESGWAFFSGIHSDLNHPPKLPTL
jgi:hypothetical protein